MSETYQTTYISVDAYDDVHLECAVHQSFDVVIEEGSSMANLWKIIKAHNEHVKAAGCLPIMVSNVDGSVVDL